MTINAAVSDLNARGVIAPVTFIIRPGYYRDQLTLRKVRGASKYNTITFKTLRENSWDVKITPYPYDDTEGFVI